MSHWFVLSVKPVDLKCLMWECVGFLGVLAGVGGYAQPDTISLREPCVLLLGMWAVCCQKPPRAGKPVSAFCAEDSRELGIYLQSLHQGTAAITCSVSATCPARNGDVNI